MKKQIKLLPPGDQEIVVDFNVEFIDGDFSVTNIFIDGAETFGINKQPSLELYNDQWTLVNNHYKVESELPADDKEYLVGNDVALKIVQEILEIASSEKTKI